MSALDLLAQHAPDQIVAFGRAGEKTAADLLADAGRIAAALPPPSANSHVLLILEEDRYAMAAALLGTLARGHAAALPPNSRRDSVLAVRERPEVVTAIHDSEAGMPSRFADLLDRGAGAPALTAPILPEQGTIATVFTSGTTGPMQPWKKSPHALLGEAHMLGRTFKIVPSDRIVATVPPGHIYGLLFTVLIPLVRGAAFCRETPHHAEAVAQSVSASGANLLVTVPVGLRAFAALAPGAFPGLKRVFSSTGPLPASVAADFRERHQHPITEILGSTETGGIAWRERCGEAPDQDERWAPLEGIKLSAAEGGQLRVDSPFLHGKLPRPFETQDLVQMHADGRFTHLGRADGIVKIGGRRVSVQEVEECLRQYADIEDAAVVAIPADGGRGHQLLAAVAPADCDLAHLRTELRKRFEPTCLPRRILRVDAIPKEKNGKIPHARLMRIFGLRANGQPINWTLDWGEPRSHDDARSAHFEVPVVLPDDYAWFDGHFDNYPVLAGAAQLKELVLPSVARAFPDLGPLERMNRVKFLNPIQPGDKLLVRITRQTGTCRVRFEIEKQAEGLCSAGQLVLASQDAPR